MRLRQGLLGRQPAVCREECIAHGRAGRKARLPGRQPAECREECIEVWQEVPPQSSEVAECGDQRLTVVVGPYRLHDWPTPGHPIGVLFAALLGPGLPSRPLARHCWSGRETDRQPSTKTLVCRRDVCSTICNMPGCLLNVAEVVDQGDQRELGDLRVLVGITGSLRLRPPIMPGCFMSLKCYGKQRSGKNRQV